VEIEYSGRASAIIPNSQALTIMTTSMKPDPTESYQEPDPLEDGAAQPSPMATDPITGGQADGNLDDLARHVSDQLAPMTGTDAPPSTSHEGDHDLAVEQYLAELLGRYGDTSAVVDPSSAVGVPQKPSAVPGGTASATKPPAEAGQSSEPQQGDEPAAPKRPTVAPEAMSAMREIANAEARRAIATHAYKTTTRSAFVKLFLACGALIVSYGLLRMSHHAANVTYWLAIAALAVGGFWVSRYMRLAGNMQRISADRSSSPAASDPAEPAEETMPAESVPA
jgi:hypothetical protein